MPSNIDREIQRGQAVLDNWDAVLKQINEVRQLERPTQLVLNRPDIMERGYYPLQATEGYNRLLNAFKVLNEDDLSPEQLRALDKAIEIQNGLREDGIKYGDYFGRIQEGPAAQNYIDDKMDQLRRTGEIYMVSGHDSHFNVTRIQMQPDGSYTYTLYDSGHETQIVGQQGDRSIANAVREQRIKPGTDIRDIIEANVKKKMSAHDSSDYDRAKSQIENSLEHPPLRTEQEYAQRRGNCTTRGQRIMVADIVKDDILSEKIYGFMNGANGTSDADIKRAIEERVQNLEKIRAEGGQNIEISPDRQLTPAQYERAANPGNYQHVEIGLDSGGRMDVYRTDPDAFTKSQLEVMQMSLQRQGIDAPLRESVSEPGKYYLYVQPEEADQLHKAISLSDPSISRPKVNPDANMIGAKEWEGGTDRHGNETKYLDVETMTPKEQQHLQNALDAQGIKYEIRPSSINGGTNVIAVTDPDAITKIDGMTDGHKNAPIIGAKQWTDITSDRNGNAAKYLDVETMTAQEQLDLENALKAQGIEYEIKPSSINGGTNVIAITNPDDIAKIQSHQDRPAVTPVPDAPEAKAPPPSEPEPVEKPNSAPTAPADTADIDVDKGGNSLTRAAESISDVSKRGGAIIGAVGGVVAGGLALIGGASKAEAAEIAAEAAIPGAETAIDVARGDEEAAVKSGAGEVAATGGSIAGAAAGAAIGTLILPGVGTVVGGLIGGIAGGFGGDAAGRAIADAAIDEAKDAENGEKSLWDEWFGDDEEPEAEQVAQAPKPEPAQESQLDLAHVKPAEMPGMDVLPEASANDEMYWETGQDEPNAQDDMYWEQKQVAQYYAPETLEAAGGEGGMTSTFGRACSGNTCTMQAVYRPEPGSHEHASFTTDLLNRESDNDANYDYAVNADSTMKLV